MYNTNKENSFEEKSLFKNDKIIAPNTSSLKNNNKQEINKVKPPSDKNNNISKVEYSLRDREQKIDQNKLKDLLKEKEKT